jgi:hypothetical protein
VKVRESGRIVSVAVIIAVAVNSDGRREVLGMDVGPSEAEPFWTEFLRTLARRGLRGVKLVISDAHEGIKAAVAKVLHASWQRCRVHFMRNVLAHAGRHGRRVVAAFIGTTFVQDDAEAASKQWRQVADQLRPKVPRLAALWMRPKLSTRLHELPNSINPLECLNFDRHRPVPSVAAQARRSSPMPRPFLRWQGPRAERPHRSGRHNAGHVGQLHRRDLRTQFAVVAIAGVEQRHAARQAGRASPAQLFDRDLRLGLKRSIRALGSARS